MRSLSRLLGLSVVTLLVSRSSGAQAGVPDAVNIPNWAAPATWSPSGVSGAYRTMEDISPAIPFVAVEPCRIADTRGTAGFAGQAGPPIIASNTTRNFQITGAPATVPAPPNGCAANTIPLGAEAVSFQFTIVTPTADGNLIAWPAGSTQPQVSVLNWPAGTVALGNGTIVPLSSGGVLSVRLNMAAGQAAHLVIDVNGYFSDQLLSTNFFDLQGDRDGFLARFVNQNAVLATTTAVLAQANSTGAGTAAVRGEALATSGTVFGGKFTTASTLGRAAGVKGVSANGDPLGDTSSCASCFVSGVRGVDDSTSGGHGVLGISRFSGVQGVLLASTGTNNLGRGVLGHLEGATPFAGYFFGNAHVAGTLTAVVKPFVQPHPSDPAKEIRYIALEGPQADVYFRGTAQVSRGVTRISIPDHFRFVADPATYSTVVTPVGSMATVAVLSEDENGIVVQASRNVKVNYLVYAERSAIKVGSPIIENIHFRPGPESDLVSHLPDSYRQLMIQNGTLREDGTINEETATRLGWDRTGGDRPEMVQPETPRD